MGIFSKESDAAKALKQEWKQASEHATTVYARTGDRRPETAVGNARDAYYEQVRADKAARKRK